MTAVNLAPSDVDILFPYRANQKEAESLIREVESLGRKAAGFRLDIGEIRLFDRFGQSHEWDVRGALGNGLHRSE